MPLDNLNPDAGGDGGGADNSNPNPEAGGGGDAGTKDWREMISEEYATHGSMANFQSLDDLAKSYISAQKLISQEKIPVPNSDDPDLWNTVYNKLGRPENPDLYELGLPEGAPEGWNSEQFQNYTTEFKKTVHDLGLTKKQAENLWGYLQNTNMSVYQKQQEAQKQQLDDLAARAKKEFGQKLPEAIKVRDAMIKQFGGEELLQEIKNNPMLDRSPAILKMFTEMSKNFSNDFISNDEKAGKTMTPREAKAKVNSILSDKNHPYNDRKHPAHMDAVDEFMKLVQATKAGD